MKKGGFKSIIFYIALIAVMMGMVYAFSGQQHNVSEMVYSDLIRELNSDNISEITVDANIAKIVLKQKDDSGNDTYQVEIPNTETFENDLRDKLIPLAKDGNIKYITKAPAKESWLVTLIPFAATIILFIFVYIIFMRQSGGGGKTMNFGKSHAKMMNENKNKVTFADVAGADEEKAELEEIVGFLKNPLKYTALGARIPRGILLVGPPGTGKTLLAKAVAGEAGVPFFSISGSDFVEMFVGVGASRVRDLFEQAKKNSPSIVFIDEIDAVGRHRGAGLGGGHDEREQTLNQLLVEMDGFGENQGVIIIAATNRPDILDPALLRPGRFDRQVVVGAPDVKGREEILRVHAKNKPLSPEVKLDVIAKTTAGFTGADLANLMNEAALLAAREDKKEIEPQHLEDAMRKVILGTEKKSRKITEEENKLTAYHEAGHAIATRFLESQDPVHEISIIPRGRAGGYTMHLPSQDKWYQSKKHMLDEIVVLLGGRVAEQLTLDDISTGASNDIERATQIARGMVTTYGMTDKIGPVKYGSSQEVFLGKDFGHTRDYSEKIACDIDCEVKRIIDECYKKCEELLTEHMDKLTEVATVLLEKEKLTGAEFETIIDGTYHNDEDEKRSENSDSADVSGNDTDLQKTENIDENGENFTSENVPESTDENKNI